MLCGNIYVYSKLYINGIFSGVQKSDLSVHPSTSIAEEITNSDDLNSTSDGVHDGAGEVKDEGILLENPAVKSGCAAPSEGEGAGVNKKEESSQQGVSFRGKPI